MKTIEQVKEFIELKLSRSVGKLVFYETKNDIINIEYYEVLKNLYNEILDFIEANNENQ
jgi:hypothetical protein